MRGEGIVAALLLTGCASLPPAGQPPREGAPDACGYTWRRAAPPVAMIILDQEADWRKYPGLCRNIGIRGCTSITANNVALVQVREPVASALAEPGECNTVWHELRHALGYTHAEAHSYTPRDFTR